MLIRITTGRFVAGVIYNSQYDRIVSTAPILSYVRGMSMEGFLQLVNRNGWTIENVKEIEEPKEDQSDVE